MSERIAYWVTAGGGKWVLDPGKYLVLAVVPERYWKDAGILFDEEERRKMTPVEIEVLLWYHCRLEPHPDVKNDVPAYRDAYEMFIKNQIIDATRLLPATTTERGQKLVEMLLEVPFPVSKWADPRKENR